MWRFRGRRKTRVRKRHRNWNRKRWSKEDNKEEEKPYRHKEQAWGDLRVGNKR